jgi:hypothetical protein
MLEERLTYGATAQREASLTQAYPIMRLSDDGISIPSVVSWGGSIHVFLAWRENDYRRAVANHA